MKIGQDFLDTVGPKLLRFKSDTLVWRLRQPMGVQSTVQMFSAMQDLFEMQME